jgi:hypothetical protein
MTTDNQPLADQLHALLTEKLGGDWRKDVTLTVRADHLYWLVFLAETGLKAKRKEFGVSGHASAEEIASLGSWTMDRETLLSKVKAALNKPTKRKR